MLHNRCAIPRHSEKREKQAMLRRRMEGRHGGDRGEIRFISRLHSYGEPLGRRLGIARKHSQDRGQSTRTLQATWVDFFVWAFSGFSRRRNKPDTISSHRPLRLRWLPAPSHIVDAVPEIATGGDGVREDRSAPPTADSVEAYNNGTEARRTTTGPVRFCHPSASKQRARRRSPTRNAATRQDISGGGDGRYSWQNQLHEPALLLR